MSLAKREKENKNKVVKVKKEEDSIQNLTFIESNLTVSEVPKASKRSFDAVESSIEYHEPDLVGLSNKKRLSRSTSNYPSHQQ